MRTRQEQRIYQLIWIKARRQEWIDENGPCNRCGSSDDLEVDHIDKSKKLMPVSSVWSMAKTNPKRIIELAKCQVLCGSCHLRKNNDENYNRVINHGTGTAYAYHHCRCDKCKTFKRAYDSLHRKKDKT